MTRFISHIERVVCPNCGAAASSRVRPGGAATCPQCGATFRLAVAPTVGDLLLGADFLAQDLPGWQVIGPERVAAWQGPVPELRATFPAGATLYYLLRSSGFFDDADASVTVRFLEGDPKVVRAGFALRFQEGRGGLVVLASGQRTYKVGYFQQPPGGGAVVWGGDLVPWTEHAALRPGLDQSNRVRVVLRGEQLRVFLNGVPASSLHHPGFQLGEVRLCAEGAAESGLGVAFTDLQLRDVPPR